MAEEEMINWNEIEEETEVEVEDILERRRIKVELEKELEVETEAEKEFNSHIAGDACKTKVQTDKQMGRRMK